MQLQNGHCTKQISAGHEPSWQPRRENDERERDPATAGGHAGNEEWRVGKRQIGAAETCARSTEQHGERADRQHGIAKRMSGYVIVADRPHHQPPARAVDKPPDPGRKRQRQIDERILPEQDAAKEGEVGQDREMKLRCRHDLFPDEARPDQPRQADPENRQCEPGRHLVDREAQGEHGKNGRQRRARRQSAERTDEGGTGHVGARESAGGAHDHHPFHAEIEHARPLGHELAGRRQQQRRRSGQHGKNDGFSQSHELSCDESASGEFGRGRANRTRAQRTAGCPGRPWSGRAGCAWKSGPARRR